MFIKHLLLFLIPLSIALANCGTNVYSSYETKDPASEAAKAMEKVSISA